MNGIPAKKLARDQGIPIERLMALLKEAGIAVSREDDPISGNDQLKLIKYHRNNEGKEASGKEVTLSDIESASNLRELNRKRIQAMAVRKIRSFSGSENDDRLSAALDRHASHTDGLAQRGFRGEI